MPCRNLQLSLLLSVSIFVAPPALCQIILNEYQSSNLTGILDEDGDTSDWIEVYNAGPGTVNLTGYGLSDDQNQPFKWVFPDVALAAEDHLLVFASDKDRYFGAAHWETVIDWGDIWKYRVNFSAPPPDWREDDFDDSTWSEGPSGFGYANGDDATEVPPCISVCIRHTFQVDDPAIMRTICLHVDYDDAFVAYLNGVELARANISSTGPPAWDQPADSPWDALIYQGELPEAFPRGSTTGLFNDGPNVLAIEVHNYAANSPDMSLIPFFSVGMDEAPPGGGEGVADTIRTVIPYLHSNFKLSASGETLSLRNAGGMLLDQIDTEQMYADLSRGRSPDGDTGWYYFTVPTPEEPNGTEGYADVSLPPEFSIQGGFYDTTLFLELSSPTGGDIYYTLDGSDPSDSSSAYIQSIQVDSTVVVRARVFEPGFLPSPGITHSYIMDDPTTLPIVSLASDPFNLWDPDHGLYVEENVWEDWEKPMHIEYFETDGALGFRQDAGVKLYGTYTRTFPQKSLRMIARPGYGASRFEYPLFAEKSIVSFKQFLLRNSGNDWCMSMFRDGLMHRLLAHTDIDRQAYEPARVYLNGQYWGIHNIRERIGKHYFESNHGVDPDNLDLIKNFFEIMEGDREHYEAMTAFIETHGLENPLNYDYIKTQMDVEQFADYQIFEIFYANTDWPAKNIAFWRPRTPEGRWRWVIYDTDSGLGLGETWNHNTMAFALEPDGPEFPNPPHSTLILRSLVENESFRHLFINRYADHLNYSFLPSRTTEMLQELASVIEDEIPRHLERWEASPYAWEAQINYITSFLESRPGAARTHILDEFSLPGVFNLSLDVDPSGSGRIDLAAIGVDSTWSGVYFLGVPVTLTAVPSPGYAFTEWSDSALPDEATVVINPDGDYAVTALFEETGSPSDTLIVINEINYNSAGDFDPEDWVELYNNGSATIGLSGWMFKDEEDSHVFTIPEGTLVPAGGYLVLVRDPAMFSSLFPDVDPILGPIGFGFGGGGELLRLFTPEGLLWDHVEYDDAPPWPGEPDGGGPTLELVNPDLDNALPQNWAASTGHGTPGELNSMTSTEEVVEGLADKLSLRLRRPAPNPLEGNTEIRFTLDRERHVRVSIHDVTGRRIAQLAVGLFPAGHHTMTWSGRNSVGTIVSPGIYLVLMQSEGFSQSRKLLLLR